MKALNNTGFSQKSKIKKGFGTQKIVSKQFRHFGGVVLNDLDVWDPFRNLRRMESRMRRLMDLDFLEGSLREPLIDIVDRGKELEVAAELPGVDRKDIELSIDGRSLSLKAKTGFEKKEEKEKEGYYYHERNYSSYYRTIPLPAEVIADKANAEFKNGILRITMPKKTANEIPKGKRIEIK